MTASRTAQKPRFYNRKGDIAFTGDIDQYIASMEETWATYGEREPAAVIKARMLEDAKMGSMTIGDMDNYQLLSALAEESLPTKRRGAMVLDDATIASIIKAKPEFTNIDDTDLTDAIQRAKFFQGLAIHGMFATARGQAEVRCDNLIDRICLNLRAKMQETPAFSSNLKCN